MTITRVRTGILLLASALALVGSLIFTQNVQAANSVPRKMIYNSRLLDSSGNAITTQHKVRFTFWIGADAVPTDLTGTGAINYSAPNFVGWKEEQSFTPDSRGYFYLEMGSVNPLPSFAQLSAATLSNLFMQVEVKPANSADTAYEILDPKPSENTVDRTPVMSVPFALNADRLDQRDIGTGSGNIILLGSGGVLSKAATPSGTNKNMFTIDSDNNASSDITLRFGDSLNKVLRYSLANNRFEFNANVHVEGNLTVQGLINGVDISNLSNAAATDLKVSSGAGLKVNIAGGNYRINGDTTNYNGAANVDVEANADNYLFFTGTGGLQTRTGGFPTDISYIPLAKVTTSAGAVTSVTDRRVLQSDNREHSILNVLHPGYADAAYDGDGTSNVGQLLVDHDGSTKYNFYQWTSTKSSLNDYDVVVRFTLPQKFGRWQSSPIKLFYKTTTGSAADNKVDIEIYDTAGNIVSLGGGNTNLTSTSWTTTNLTFNGSPAWSAGQTFLMKVRMSSKSSSAVQIGDLELRYVELDNE
jgi:hypothetical protein